MNEHPTDRGDLDTLLDEALAYLADADADPHQRDRLRHAILQHDGGAAAWANLERQLALLAWIPPEDVDHEDAMLAHVRAPADLIATVRDLPRQRPGNVSPPLAGTAPSPNAEPPPSSADTSPMTAETPRLRLLRPHSSGIRGMPLWFLSPLLAAALLLLFLRNPDLDDPTPAVKGPWELPADHALVVQLIARQDGRVVLLTPEMRPDGTSVTIVPRGVPVQPLIEGQDGISSGDWYCDVMLVDEGGHPWLLHRTSEASALQAAGSRWQPGFALLLDGPSVLPPGRYRLVLRISDAPLSPPAPADIKAWSAGAGSNLPDGWFAGTISVEIP